MEYQKAYCLEVIGELCLHCKWNDWIGPKCNKISQPILDPKNLMHYLDVFSTPLVDGKGRNRETDNCQPKVQIMKAFNEGLISLERKEGISELCKEFAYEKKHIVATLEHINDIEIRKEKKEQDKGREIELHRRKNLPLTLTGLA